LTDFQERTGLRVNPDLYHLVKTLGGLVMARLGRLPAPGGQVTLNGRSLRVEAMDGHRVATVRLLPPDQPANLHRR
jgi:CBS domain containing-hemolysin-like protein